MAHKFKCQSCGESLQATPERVGRRARCPRCRTVLVVPEPDIAESLGDPMTLASTTRSGERSLQDLLHSIRPVGKGKDASDVSMVLTVPAALVLTTLFYLLLLPVRSSGFAKMFYENQWVPVALVVLFFWAAAIIILKWRRLTRQKDSTLFDVLPTEVSEKVTQASIPLFVEHIRSLPGSFQHSFLISRVLRAFGHLRAGNSRSEVATVLMSQSDLDAASVESSYTMVKVLIWAIPILGFIGTVMGISQSVGSFSGSLEDVSDIAVLKESLTAVTSGLGVAFDTTLIALVMSVLIMFPASFVQKAEEDLLNLVEEYCNENLLRRLVGDTERGDIRGIQQAVEDAMVVHHAELKAWTAKLESIGSVVTDQVKAGWVSMLERQTESQRRQVDHWKEAFDDAAREQLHVADQIREIQGRVAAAQAGHAEQMAEARGHADEHANRLHEQGELFGNRLDSMLNAVNKGLGKLVKQSATTQAEAARAMQESAKAVQLHAETLRPAIDGLNRAMAKLGERQIEVHVPARNGWFRRRKTNA